VPLVQHKTIINTLATTTSNQSVVLLVGDLLAATPQHHEPVIAVALTHNPSSSTLDITLPNNKYAAIAYLSTRLNKIFVNSPTNIHPNQLLQTIKPAQLVIFDTAPKITHTMQISAGIDLKLPHLQPGNLILGSTASAIAYVTTHII
jgi:hypothetical protein